MPLGAIRGQANVTGSVLTVEGRVGDCARLLQSALASPHLCDETARSFQNIINNIDRPRLSQAQLSEIRATLERCVREGFLTQAYVDQLFREYNETLRDNSPTPPRP